MDLFNALWDNPEQRKRPPDDNFQLFSMEEWLAMSSTHKILCGSLQCPLPLEVERPGHSTSQARGLPENSRNQKARSNPSQSPQQNDLKTKEREKYVPGLAKFPHFNRISCLTAVEQRDCLALLLKFGGKSIESLSASEKIEHQLFQSLYNRVKVEQKEYLEEAKKSWPEFVERAVQLEPNPYNFFIQYWVDKVTRAMAQYPKHYRKLKKITLNGKTTMTAKLQFSRSLLNIGKVPIVNLPKFEHAYRIPTQSQRLRTWELLHVPQSYLNETLHNVPVSRDPNAERLARQHGAKIVISTSGLRCLLDNHNEKKHPPPSGVGKSWILPVTVKEHRTFCDGKPALKTIVFIDKPLPLAKLTKFEKVSWFQKHGLFASLINHKLPDGMEFDIKGDDIFLRKESAELAQKNASPGATATLTPSDTNILKINKDKLSVSAVTKISEIPDKQEVNARDVVEQTPVVKDMSNVLSTPASDSNISEDDVDSGDEYSLTIVCSDDDTNAGASNPSSEVKNISSEQAQERAPSEKLMEATDSETSNMDVKEGNAIITENLDVEEKEESIAKTSGPADSTQVSNKPTVTNASKTWENVPAPPQVKIVNGNALPPSCTNVTYNMWSLQSQAKKTGIDEMQSQCSWDCNILVRSRVDGCEKLRPGVLQPVSLASKPEFQLEYAPGVISLSDLTRQWAKLLIQPGSCLNRIRVNTASSELVKVEKRTPEEVLQEAQTAYGENLTDTLLILQEVLSELLQLPQGLYVLSHSPQMASTAELLLKANEGEIVDLDLAAEFKSRPGEISCDVPWQPLDATVAMPKNLHYQCMPCTFHSPKGPLIVAKPRKPQPVKPVNAKPLKNKKSKKKSKKKKCSSPKAGSNADGTGE